MMAIRPVDQSTLLSVANTSHAAVTIGKNTKEACTKVAMLNTGATVLAVRFGAVGATGAAALPTDGAWSDSQIILPALMTKPVVYTTPSMPCDVTAIGSAAGPSSLWITPCEE